MDEQVARLERAAQASPGDLDVKLELARAYARAGQAAAAFELKVDLWFLLDEEPRGLPPWGGRRVLRRELGEEIAAAQRPALEALQDLLAEASWSVPQQLRETLAREAPVTRLHLDLTSSDSQEEALRHTGRLTSLRELGLGAVSDPGALQHLRGLTRLARLFLSGGAIADRNLELLSDLTGLRSLSMWYTQVTAAGAAALRSRYPTLEVDHLSLAGGPG